MKLEYQISNKISARNHKINLIRSASQEERVEKFNITQHPKSKDDEVKIGQKMKLNQDLLMEFFDSELHSSRTGMNFV